MNVFKKLQTVVGKKEKNYSAFDEIIGKDRNIELGDIDKLKVGDLVDIVKKYDQFVIKMRKDTGPIVEQHEELTEKVNIFETQLKVKIQESDEMNKQLQDLQRMLNTELQKNIQLQESYEFLNNKYEHLKSKEEDKSKDKGEEEEELNETVKVVISADSELLMFTNEKELQHLRNLFDQLKGDTDAFIETLHQLGKTVTDQEEQKREKETKKKEKKDGTEKEQQDGEQATEENQEEEEEEQENGEEKEEEEQEEEEEELTLEELCGNTWDSLAQFNEQIEILSQRMKEFNARKEKSANNNTRLISSYEDQLALKQKEIDSTYQEKEKEKETRKLLESDLLSLTGRFSEEKRRNAELEEKAANLMKQMGDLFNEREQAIGQLKQVIEEKTSLTQELSRTQLTNTQEDTKLREELEDLQHELEDCEEENDQLKEQLKKAQEDLYLKTKELDNKDRQDKLKSAQVAKDMQKLEAKVQDAQKDLEKQIETSHETLQRLKLLEEKRVAEKNKLKQLKEKIKESNEELNKKKLENAKDLELKNKQLNELEEELNGYKSKSNVKEELVKLTLERDVKINNLQILLEDKTAALKQSQEELTAVNEEMEDLKMKVQQQDKLIKQLQEKRELSIQEIQKLHAQIDIFRSHANPQTQAKIAEIQNLLDRASTSTLNQSSNSLQEGNPSPGKQKFSMNFKQSDINLKQSSQLPLKPLNMPQQSSQSSPVLPEMAKDEMKYLADMKREMEAVYKEYINIAFSYEKNTPKENTENFMKLEKKINLSIKKAQDLIDAIEDAF